LIGEINSDATFHHLCEIDSKLLIKKPSALYNVIENAVWKKLFLTPTSNIFQN